MSTARAAVHLHIIIAISVALVSCAESVDDRSSALTQKRTLDESSPLSSDWRSNPSDVALQKQLVSHGYDPGTIDGVMGPNTMAAIKRFQKDRNLIPSGTVGPATRAYLMPPSVDEVSTFMSRSEIRKYHLTHSQGNAYLGYLSPLSGDAGGYRLLSTYQAYPSRYRSGNDRSGSSWR